MTINVKRGFRNILKLITSFIKAFHLNIKLTYILSDGKFHLIIGINFYIPAKKKMHFLFECQCI